MWLPWLCQLRDAFKEDRFCGWITVNHCFLELKKGLLLIVFFCKTLYSDIVGLMCWLKHYEKCILLLYNILVDNLHCLWLKTGAKKHQLITHIVLYWEIHPNISLAMPWQPSEHPHNALAMFRPAATRTMKVILRHKDLHAYGKICESVHKTASANKICKRKRRFVKV